MATKKPAAEAAEVAVLKPLNEKTVKVTIRGTAPYVQNKFSDRTTAELEQMMLAGDKERSNKKKVRPPRDFADDFEQSIHVSRDGAFGIPANGIKRALVAACRLTGFHMSKAKQLILIHADMYGDDGTPLVKINSVPTMVRNIVRLPSGAPNIAVRAMFPEGWTATLRIVFDADLMTATDLVNLIHRAGRQVGIGSGRTGASGGDGVGMGWGMFEVINNKDA